MTNVVSFQSKLPPIGAPDLVENLEILHAYSQGCGPQISMAQSLDKVLRTYGEMLRRYYEIDGAIKSSLRVAEVSIRVNGSDDDIGRIDCILDCIAKIEARLKGPHPWLSLPNHARTKTQARQIVAFVNVTLWKAIQAGKALGKNSARYGGIA